MQSDILPENQNLYSQCICNVCEDILKENDKKHEKIEVSLQMFQYPQTMFISRVAKHTTKMPERVK